MKTKVIILIALSAIVTASFTFASDNADRNEQPVSSSQSSADAPAGGFATEDKF